MYSSYYKIKVYKVHSEFVPSMKTCTKYTELQTLQNNLDFSLYAIPFVYYEVATSGKKWSSREVSTYKKYIVK